MTVDIIYDQAKSQRDLISMATVNARKMNGMNSTECEQYVAGLCARYDLVVAVWEEAREGVDGFGFLLVKGDALFDGDPEQAITVTGFPCVDATHADELRARFGGRPQ